MVVVTISGKKCSYCGSLNRVIFNSEYDNYLCHRHYMQFYHTGNIKDRFRNSPNDIVIHEKYSEIILQDKNGKETAKAIIDTEDIDKCNVYKWSLHSEGYAYGRNKNNNKILLHNLIINNNPKAIIDHKNHNKLDNRKYNLRICNYSENNMNSAIPSNNTSGTKGISYNKRDKVWEAYVSKNGKRLHKYFKDKSKAIEFRKKIETKLFGEFNYD
jgi:hypothetical protein